VAENANVAATASERKIRPLARSTAPRQARGLELVETAHPFDGFDRLAASRLRMAPSEVEGPALVATHLLKSP